VPTSLSSVNLFDHDISIASLENIYQFADQQ